MIAEPLICAWAGFIDGCIDLELEPDSARDQYATLYKTRKEALKYYEDVRRVEVYEAVK